MTDKEMDHRPGGAEADKAKQLLDKADAKYSTEAMIKATLALREAVLDVAEAIREPQRKGR